jgi:hypothetical protein
MHQFMGANVQFSNASADIIMQQLQKPTLRAYNSKVLSRLLNRQVKAEIHAILREETLGVLEQIENELNKRSKSAWAPCFCVTVILCICMEEVQTAVNGFAMYGRNQQDDEISLSSDDILRVCRKLDDWPYNHLAVLFHGVYKSKKLPSSRQHDRVYNPVRDGPEIDLADGLDQRSADLANDVRQLIIDHSKLSPMKM